MRVKIGALIIGLTLFVQPLVVYGNGIQKQKEFVDIKNHWAKNQIEILIQNEIVKGTEIAKNKFSIKPDELITRAEFIVTLIKSKDLKVKTNQIKAFKDIGKDKWYKAYIDIATSNNLISGYPDGCFKPESGVTRAELAVLISKINGWSIEKKDKIENKFKDIKPSDWHFKSIMNCYKEGLLKGYSDGTFQASKKATRAEAFFVIATNFVKFENLKTVKPSPNATLADKSKETKTSRSGDLRKVSAQPKPSTTNISTNTPTNTPTNKPTNTPTNKPTNTPTNKPTNTPTNKPTNKPTNTPINKTTNKPTNTPTNTPTNKKEISTKEDTIVKDNIDKKTDSDSDGLSDYYESIYKTNNLVDDTDGDGLSDYYEVKTMMLETDPLNPQSLYKGYSDSDLDSDGDGLSNSKEKELGLNPLEYDTDKDGLPDGAEVLDYKTNPKLFSTKSDKNSDWIEVDSDSIKSIAYDEVVKYASYAERKDDLKACQSMLDIWKIKSGDSLKVLKKIPTLKSFTGSYTGKYDENTVAMVRLFQYHNDLNQTGIIDEKTSILLCNQDKWSVKVLNTKGYTYKKQGFGESCFWNLEANVSYKDMPKYYSQTFGPWSKEPYYPTKRNIPQNGRIVARNGCGPSSIAMVISTIIDKDIDPAKMAIFSMENDCINENYDSIGELYPKVAKAYGLNIRFTSDFNLLKAELKKGKKFAIVSMGKGHFTTGGHLLAIMGVVDFNGEERFIVYDSNSGNGSYNLNGNDDSVILSRNVGQVFAKKDVLEREVKLGIWIINK